MSDLPQLFMRKPTLKELPPLSLPQGFALHSHCPGQEDIWESIVKEAFDTPFTFEKCIVSSKGYRPDYVLYISKDGVDIATTTAVEKAQFPGDGWFHMVGVRPSARGLGAGRLVCLAALHSLAARGYERVALSTDDWRLPAISLYLSLGFEPLLLHESHPERWEKVKSALLETARPEEHR